MQAWTLDGHTRSKIIAHLLVCFLPIIVQRIVHGPHCKHREQSIQGSIVSSVCKRAAPTPRYRDPRLPIDIAGALHSCAYSFGHSDDCRLQLPASAGLQRHRPARYEVQSVLDREIDKQAGRNDLLTFLKHYAIFLALYRFADLLASIYSATIKSTTRMYSDGPRMNTFFGSSTAAPSSMPGTLLSGYNHGDACMMQATASKVASLLQD